MDAPRFNDHSKGRPGDLPPGSCDIRFSRLLLIAAAVYCVLASFIVPPFFGQPDESRRWSRAYALSQGEIFTERQGDAAAMVRMDVRADIYQSRFLPFLLGQRELSWQSASEITHSLNEEPARERDVNVAATVSVNSLLYLPPAAGIFLARGLGLGFMEQLWAARLFNALASLAIVLVIVRLAGPQRLLITALAVSPPILGFAAAVDHTAIDTLIPLAVVLSFWRLSQEDSRIGMRHLAMVSALFLVLCLTRQPMAAFALMALIIPARRFGGTVRKLGMLFFCGVPALAYQAWWVSAGSYDYLAYFGLGQADPETQIRSVLSDPMAFLSLSLDSFLDGRAVAWAAALFPSVHGVNWLSQNLWIGILPLLLSAAAALRSPSEATGAGRQALALPLAAACTAGALLVYYLGFLLYFNEPGTARIDGVSSRYFAAFIPVLIFTLALAAPKAWANARSVRALVAGQAVVSWAILATTLYGFSDWLLR